MDPWNPDQYARFEREREQPFDDLLALIQPAPRLRVVDLGCGTGNLTRRLHHALDARETLGIDRSERMLDVARRPPLAPGLRFEQRTIESFHADGVWDLVFSNAALHWIEDHQRLIPRLLNAVAPGGQLAFQVPAMHLTASHALPDELASGMFRDAFGGWARPQPVLEADDYARLLFRAGIADPKVRLVIYPHVLTDRDAVVEWMKGTLLTEYEKRLPPEVFAAFVEEYRRRLRSRLADQRPYLFPFRRILCWGRKAGSAHLVS